MIHIMYLDCLDLVGFDLAEAFDEGPGAVHVPIAAFQSKGAHCQAGIRHQYLELRVSAGLLLLSNLPLVPLDLTGNNHQVRVGQTSLICSFGLRWKPLADLTEHEIQKGFDMQQVGN